MVNRKLVKNQDKLARLSYLDLPRRKRPVVDSFCVLNPPQYTTDKLGGKDAMCCHVSKAPRLLARALNSSMLVFTIWNEKPGGSTPFSWNVYTTCQGNKYCIVSKQQKQLKIKNSIRKIIKQQKDIAQVAMHGTVDPQDMLPGTDGDSDNQNVPPSKSSTFIQNKGNKNSWYNFIIVKMHCWQIVHIENVLARYR